MSDKKETKIITEFKKYQQKSIDDELFEMSNFKGSRFGLDDNIVIFIGLTVNTPHNARIKVSNIPSKISDCSDCFIITVPDLEIKGEVKKHITSKKMDSIKAFIKINELVIMDFCNGVIDVSEFLDNIEKI